MADSTKSKISISLDPPDLERVDELAARERAPRSTVIRRLVVEGLRDEAAREVAA